MNYVVMFKGGVETQEFFSIEIGKELEARGYGIHWFDLMVSEASSRVLEEFLRRNENDYIVACTFNYNGIAGEEGLYDEEANWNIWDAHGIHVYNMVVDHPLYYHKYRRYNPRKYTHLSIDRNHVRYMKRFFPEVNLGEDTSPDKYGTDTFNDNIDNIDGDMHNKLAGFLPLGGTEINRDRAIIADKPYLDMKERPIDVVFTGNYTPAKNFDRFLAGMDQEYREFYHSLVDEAMAHPDELIEDIAERCLKAEMGDITDEELMSCMPNMMFVDLSVRFNYRAAVIRALADSGIKVHTFGAGWNLLECSHPENIIQAGNVDSQKCLDVISQSKISINVMPWFKDGAHDRIFNSMLNGALCVSDGSKYLREEFTDGEDIAFFDLKAIDKVPELVLKYLSDEDRLSHVAENGYSRCARRHTWSERARSLHELFENDKCIL